MCFNGGLSGGWAKLKGLISIQGREGEREREDGDVCVCVYLYSPGHVEKVNYKNPIYMLRSDGEGLNTKKVKVKHMYIFIYIYIIYVHYRVICTEWLSEWVKIKDIYTYIYMVIVCICVRIYVSIEICSDHVWRIS